MTNLAFELEYEGPALQTHEMDVRDLAPALLSTAEMFQELNRQLYPVAPPLAVNVRATAEGSFLVQLKLVYDATVGTLSGHDVTAGANLAALVEAAGTMVIYARRKFRSQPVSQESSPGQPGVIHITFEDGASIEVPEHFLQVRDNLSIQRSLAEVIRPVGRPGVDIVRFRQDDITIAEVPKADLAAFDAPAGPVRRDIIHAGEREAHLTIHTAGFHTNRWRFYDGQSLLWATISDGDFIAKLGGGTTRVGPLDVLHCCIREEQWRDPAGFHSEVEILRVLDVDLYDPNAQGTLNLDDPYGRDPL